MSGIKIIQTEITMMIILLNYLKKVMKNFHNIKEKVEIS